MTISERVLGAIRRHDLVPPGGRVAVALSGGSDSVALLLLLRELQAAGDLVVIAAAHMNHGLRESAHRDEQFCRALADSLGIPFRAELIDIRARAARDRTSLEDAGRQARYELFERVAEELGADAVATGHTRDDQAETFLLRLLRGAGPRGLGGIHPKVRLQAGAPEAPTWSLPAGAPEARRWVVRPLLDIGRAELRDYLAAQGQPYCEDESNADLAIPRNRVRHELLPLLRERYSPAIADVLAREAAIARADEDRLQHEAIDLARSIVLRNRATESDEIELDVAALAALHPALATRVARVALQGLTPDRFVGFDHVEGLLELARSDGSKHASLSLPGQYAERRGSRIVLSRAPFKPFSNSFRVPLSIPGEVILAEQGWAVSAALEPGRAVDPVELDAVTETLTARAQRVSGRLTVRSRQPGDWLRPLGMGGRRKKLQDVLVDRKVARDRRDSIPVVVDESDRIVWVVGEAVTEDFRVTEPSQAVIFLKARQLGGQG